MIEIWRDIPEYEVIINVKKVGKYIYKYEKEVVLC